MSDKNQEIEEPADKKEKSKSGPSKIVDEEIIDPEPVEPEDLGPDLVEPDEDDEGGESLVAALSRRVGIVARTVSDGIQSVSGSLTSARQVAGTSSKGAVEQLLAELGALVSEHEEDGYASLRDHKEFWRLIAALAAVRPRKRAKPAAETGPRRTVKRRAQAQSEEAPSKATVKTEEAPANKPKKPKKSEETPSEAAVKTEGETPEKPKEEQPPSGSEDDK